MNPRTELLLGRIALREKLITREQLYDCLLAQERNPSRSLGEIMIRRRILSAAQVRQLVAIQTEAVREARQRHADGQDAALLGRLLIEKGFCTNFQVNECLRLMGRMEEMGISPVPPLGDILIQRGYLTADGLTAALQFQDLSLYACPDCGARLEATATVCASCGARVPALLAKMAGSVEEALDERADEFDVDLPAEVREAAKDPERHFGRYVLVKELGRGGSGVVWQAWQRDVNRTVALKMLSHESETGAGIRTPFGDAEDVRRFYNEIRAAAEMRHENIVSIYDFGTVDDYFYYTMDFVEGVTFDDLVRDGMPSSSTTVRAIDEAAGAMDRTRPAAVRGDGRPQLPMREALRIMRDVARGVQFAHDRGIYHRDIKPGNIIVTPRGVPKIADFGLAKVVRIGDAAYVKGVIMGTPYYMPPEQAEGDMEKVDHLSDVYSLGAVLYEAVTGLSPYSERSPDTVIDLLPKEAPQTPRQVRRDLPEAIGAIIEKAMRREKRRRYPSAAAFADDIDAYLAGRPLATEPDGAGEPPKGLLETIKRMFR